MKKSIFFLFFVCIFVLMFVPAQLFAAHTVADVSVVGGGDTVERGEEVTITITGTGFDCTGVGGCPSVTFTPVGITVTGAILDTPTSISATIEVDALAAFGSRSVNVTTGPLPAHAENLDNALEVVAAGAGGGGGGGAPPRERIPSNITTADQFIDLLDTLVDWLFVVVLVGSVIFIVLAGWQFISGGGEPQNVAQARNKLLYAAIGIVVAVLSRGIVAALRNLIGS